MFEHDSNTAVWGISPVLLIVGVVFHICSIATPHWMATPVTYMGLWTYCTIATSSHRTPTELEYPTTVHCSSVNTELNSSGQDHSWFRAVQGLEIAATVLMLTSLVTGLMRINLGHRIWQIACGVCALMAGIFGVAGVIVFAMNCGTIADHTLSWAFVFNCASSTMLVMSGPLLIIDALLNI